MSFTQHIGIPYAGERFCAVLAAQVLADAGIPWPDVDQPAAAADWQRVERPRPYDVVVFNRGGQPGHVGVCVGRGRFLHVEEGATSRIEHLASPLHAPRIEGIYRYTPRAA